MIQFNYTLLYNIIMYIMTMYYNLFYNMYYRHILSSFSLIIIPFQCFFYMTVISIN